MDQDQEDHQEWKGQKAILEPPGSRVLLENKDLEESKDTLETLESMEKKGIEESRVIQDHLDSLVFKDHPENLYV